MDIFISLQKAITMYYSKRTFFFIGLVLLMTITFDTLQQLYFIRRYDIVEGITFWDLLQGQAYKWLIWVVLGYFLYGYSYANSKKEVTLSYYIRLVLVIGALVILNIIAISFLEIINSGDVFSVSLFFEEYMTFFIFQKAPMYTLGYIAIVVILHLLFANTALQFQVQQLSEVKTVNEQLYMQLKEYSDDKATVLNIKIGNKRRIIPIAQICWVEADDYCVKVHTHQGESLTMRSSLKALQEKLGAQFLRVHRNAIVNMDFVKELKITNPPSLLLLNDDQIAISKSQLKGVRDFLGKLEIS